MLILVPNIRKMIPDRTLIKVGTSHALIIPARLMKKKGYTAETVFDIDEDGDALVIRPRKAQSTKITLPKLTGPIEIDDNLKSVIGSVSYTKEEIESDPILKAILEG